MNSMHVEYLPPLEFRNLRNRRSCFFKRRKNRLSSLVGWVIAAVAVANLFAVAAKGCSDLTPRSERFIERPVTESVIFPRTAPAVRGFSRGAAEYEMVKKEQPD